MNEVPYKAFGDCLKEIREKAKESIAEVSGAVELDTTILTDIELGKSQPSEDVVLLLISHFALKEDEALRMWELAGYEQSRTGTRSYFADETGQTETAYVTQGDVRIVYTDMVHINANKYGVVINFLQGLGPKNQPMAISRVGMSREHAESLIDVLRRTLEMSAQQPKQLGKSTEKPDQ